MTGPTMPEELELEVENGVAHFAINRPEKLNALTRSIFEGLIEGIKWASVAPEVRSILISGRGRMFCSGDDLDGLDSVYDVAPSPATEVYEGPYPLLHRMLVTRKPIVAAVQGGAYVAGLDIALAADYRVSSASTKLGPVGLTLGGAGGMSMLPMYLPIATVRRLIFKAEPIGGEAALNLGLVDELVEDDQILTRAKEMSEQFAKGPTLAYGATKAALLAMHAMSPLQAIQTEQDYAMASFRTKDMQEAMTAWSESRTPQFVGE